MVVPVCRGSISKDIHGAVPETDVVSGKFALDPPDKGNRLGIRWSS
jgi:hypothetical protein